MNAAVAPAYLEASACPSCYSKLILTKENVLLCQNCLLGFRVQEGVPDLRFSEAIHFRKKTQASKDDRQALFTFLVGEKRNQTFEVKKGHCAVFCRSPKQDFDSDTTFVGGLDASVQNTRVDLDSKTRKVVEKSLLQASSDLVTDGIKPESLLGGFVRDTDVHLDDSVVSRTHALIYQNTKGVWVLDLVSKNGTFVNGKEVEHAQLKTNDVVSLGGASFRVNFV